MEKFDREELEFFLPDRFKGLSKDYLMDCIFNEDIQKRWSPQKGDIMVGPTGNIFVISVVEQLHESIGGRKYYFGGGSCNRDGGSVLDSTYYFTANRSGKYIHPTKGEQTNPYHSSIKNFRFVPYPHELVSRRKYE
jgi:hypothetical protein